jgi:cytidylate kinase
VTKPSIVAIDGTSASGKSTIGGLLAARLGYVFFDTGIMYRAVTWEALRRGIPIEDEEGVTKLAEEVEINIELPTVDDGRQFTVLVDGVDVTWEIRKPEVEAAVSPVSAYAGVRHALTAQQRRIGRRGHVVMVGRDIGTVVLPEADVKIFLDATPEERARRRLLEMRARGQSPTFEQVLEAIRQRDKYDSERKLAPLRQADNAIYLDTTGLSIDDVLCRVLSLVDGAGDC